MPGVIANDDRGVGGFDSCVTPRYEPRNSVEAVHRCLVGRVAVVSDTFDKKPGKLEIASAPSKESFLTTVRAAGRVLGAGSASGGRDRTPAIPSMRNTENRKRPLIGVRGGTGIRTQGTRKGLNSFQDCRLRPLGHPSGLRPDLSETLGRGRSDFESLSPPVGESSSIQDTTLPRRGRDLNPRGAHHPYSLSRRAPSTARPPLPST